MRAWQRGLNTVAMLLFVVGCWSYEGTAVSPLFLDLTGEHFSPDAASVQQLLSQATLGSASAQYYVALVYLYGLQGVSQDVDKALSWLRKAALAVRDLRESMCTIINRCGFFGRLGFCSRANGTSDAVCSRRSCGS